MDYLRYDLFEGQYINRFLVTQVTKSPQQFEKAVLNGKVNEWLKKGYAIHENPCRKEFIAKRKDALPEYYAAEHFFAQAQVDVMGCSQPVSVYFPFQNTRVDASAFYYNPTYLRRYAFAKVYSAENAVQTWVLSTCGGAALWVNGNLVIDFTPFTRNDVKSCEVEISLKEGLNDILVCLDDLAERDTDYYFELKTAQPQKLEIILPLKHQVNQLNLNRLELMLEEISFAQECFMDEPVYLQIENPLPEDIEIHVQYAPGDLIESLQSSHRLIHSKTLTLPAGEKKLCLMHTDDAAPSYYYFTVGVEYEGCALSRKIGNQLFRKAWLNLRGESAAQRKRHAQDAVLTFAEDGTYKAAVMLFCDVSVKKAQEILFSELDGIAARKDCSDFHFIVMMYIYQNFKNVLNEPLLKKMEKTMLEYRYWIDEPGDDVMWFFSENHALLFHSCQYLAGGFLKDKVFVNSGLTGLEQQKKARKLLEEWFEGFFAEFITEWNSSAYIPVDALGLGMLYELTQPDDPLHEKAKKALDMVFRCLCLYGHQGVLTASYGRTYEKELKGNFAAGTSALLYLAYDKGCLNKTCLGYLPFILGDYQPPEEYARYLELNEQEALIVENTQGFEKHVNLYLYKDAQAVLSTAVGFKPFSKGYQEHIVHAALDGVAQVFVNHPGESFAYGSGRPNYWAGNKYLPYAAQYENCSIIRYSIPKGERIDYTHAYVPLTAFSRYLGEEHCLVLEKEGAYIALKAANGLMLKQKGPTKHCELISMGEQNAWLIKVGKLENRSLEDVMAEMKQTKITLTQTDTTVCSGWGVCYRLDHETGLWADGEAVHKYPLSVEGKVVIGRRKI